MTVTICTSYKFIDQMFEQFAKLTEEGHIVLLPAFNCYKKSKAFYMSLHKKRIEMSDAIFVINVDGYIGESVKEEIAYADLLHKKVLFLEPPFKTPLTAKIH